VARRAAQVRASVAVDGQAGTRRRSGPIGPFRSNRWLAASALSSPPWRDGAEPASGATLTSSAELAHRRPGRRVSAGFRIGYVTNRRRISSPTAVADISVRLPIAGERVEIAGEIGAWSRKLRDSAAGEMVTTAVKAIPLRGRIVVEMPVARLSLFAGVGGGLVMTRHEVSSASGGVSSTSARVPAVGGLFGARLRAGRGRLGLELGWWRAELDRPELRDSIGGLELSAGYALGF
jgi:hypothetical protein